MQIPASTNSTFHVHVWLSNLHQIQLIDTYRFSAAVSNRLPCRFMADSKEILDKLEACFENLAECAHTVDSHQKPLEESLVVLFKGLPCFLSCNYNI